jgi:beta-phosphoglucomutase-like phosphatase (HAD superfamily)
MRLDIPAGDFAGYIFDCDGTLVDSMPAHFRAWDRAMRAAGLPHALDEDHFYSFGGVPTRRVAELLCEHYRLPADADWIFHEKERQFLEGSGDLRLIEPVADFAQRVSRTHPVSVGTGSPHHVVGSTLKAVGLAELFCVVVTPEDVRHGKPAPDLFLRAAELMEVPAERCLVFEDAEPGFKAAAAAGMACVRVPSRALAAR